MMRRVLCEILPYPVSAARAKPTGRHTSDHLSSLPPKAVQPWPVSPTHLRKPTPTAYGGRRKSLLNEHTQKKPPNNAPCVEARCCCYVGFRSRTLTLPPFQGGPTPPLTTCLTFLVKNQVTTEITEHSTSESPHCTTVALKRIPGLGKGFRGFHSLTPLKTGQFHLKGSMRKPAELGPSRAVGQTAGLGQREAQF